MLNQTISELAIELGKVLQQRNWTISTAESCTGGGVAFAITSVAGSSTWFERSFVTYSNEAKSALVGVAPEVLQQYGAVSAQTVEQMARGCAQQADADLGISISGIAGPDGGSPEKPVGTVWFGFSVDGTISTQHQIFAGDREAVRLQAIAFALSTGLSLLTAS